MSAPPTIRPVLLGLIAIGVAVAGQLCLQQDGYFDAVLLFGAAVGLFLYTFGLRNRAALPRPVSPRDGLPWVAAGWSLWIGLGALAAAGWLGWSAWQEFYANEPETLLGWRLQLAAVAAVLVGAYLIDGPVVAADWRVAMARLRSPRESAADHRLAPGTVILWLALILTVAAFMRFWRFDRLPFGVWYDEANHALQALRILENAEYWPIFEGSIHGPTPYLYLTALSFHLFGVSIQSLRAVSAVMGIGMVVAAYLAGRELYDQRTGLLVAFVAAVGVWAVVLSRFGMFATISTPLFTLLAGYFLLRSLRTFRYSDFAWTGFWLGIGLSFYTSFRLFVIGTAIFLVYFVVLESIRRRGLLPLRFWIGMLFAALTGLAVVLPLLLFAQKHPDLFWARVQDTFIFVDKAPGERWPALWENIRLHLLMFNHRGDPNGRHNLPGAPMLDPITGALMVLGAALALWRWRDPRWIFLPLWLLTALLGGILSLSFEAPQSLRANGALPAAYLLAAAPLYVIWRAWRRADGRYYPNALAVPLIVLLLLPMGAGNARRYFVTQANDFASWAAFSTAETITGNLLADLDPNTDAYVISFFHTHPTLNFLAGNDAPYQRIETTDRLPLAFNPDRSALLILDAERDSLFNEAKRLYPQGVFTEHRAPFGGPPVLYTVELTPQTIASVTGLSGTYFFGTDWQGFPVGSERRQDFQIDWASDVDIAPPFSAEWSGVLRIHEYGLYQFFMQAGGPSELTIGGVPVLQGAGERAGAIFLAEGNHAVRLRTSVPDPADPGQFNLYWRPSDRDLEPMPASAFYSAPVRSNGLLGRYFPNGEWREPEALARIDPQLDIYFHNPPLPRPYTVEWRGKIAIPQSGRYDFGLMSIDDSVLSIDGAEIASSPAPNQVGEGSVVLTGGLHEILVRFGDRTDHTNIALYWRPPWGEREVVPSSVLFPPQGSYADVRIPTIGDLAGLSPQDRTLRPQPAQAEVLLPALFETLAAGLSAPRGVAVDATVPEERRYALVDSDTARLLVLDATGLPVIEQRGPAASPDDPARFGAPFDVHVSRFGWIYVLDSEHASVSVFDGNGTFVQELPGGRATFDRARGLFVGDDGAIWIAQTPTGRIVVLASDGEIQREIPVWPGEAAQPVDVAVAPDGTIYVVDAGLYKLIRYDAGGRRQVAWDLPPFNSLDSSRVAVDRAGTAYVTIPEESMIWAYDAAGAQIGRWLVPSEGGLPARPVGIDIGPEGEILITDVANGRVLKILPEG